MDNRQIAGVFEEMANILDISGANFFRVNAYKKASLTILNMPQDLRTMVAKEPEAIEKIPGVGDKLAAKIIELVKTGKCEEHEKMKKSIPEGLLELLELRGVGPKKVKMLYMNLAVKNIEELKAAAEKHLIRDLEGMGEKSETEILKAIDEHKKFSTKRSLISEALQEAQAYLAHMKKCKIIDRIAYAGSLRRMQETVGDIDILTTVKDAKKSHEEVMKHFIAYSEVMVVTSEGDTRSSVILQSGITVDLRVVANESFGSALHYFTGDKNHNIKIRDMAKKQGMKVNEYGVFKGEKMVAGETEEDVFKVFGLPFIIPEIRRDEGEFEYGLKHKKFPKFVELKDIKGDCHCHSRYSDGKNTIEEMAQVFMERGYEYFAITDHSPSVGVAGGLNKTKILKQWKEVDALQKKLKGKIQILKGAEVDILKDGSMDFEDAILKELDIVIASAHLHNRLPADQQTKRIIKALENPYVKILGHPTGRLINKRAGMEFDMEKVIDAAAANKVALEINSSPSRLDLAEKYVRVAKDRGAKFVINTDSHSVQQPEFMAYGVGMARRGWLEKSDVLNTMSWKEFDSYF